MYTNIHEEISASLFVREGYNAPSKTKWNWIDDARELQAKMYDDDWSGWMALPCEDGRWGMSTTAIVNAHNGQGTDKVGSVGGPSVIARVLNDAGPSGLQLLAESIKTAQQKHGVTGIQLVTHPLCGETHGLVCTKIPEAEEVYQHPSKTQDMHLWLLTHKVELEIHRNHLDQVRDWIFETFPHIDAVQYLRVIKFHLDPFQEHVRAVDQAIETLQRSGQWDFQRHLDLVPIM